MTSERTAFGRSIATGRMVLIIGDLSASTLFPPDTHRLSLAGLKDQLLTLCGLTSASTGGIPLDSALSLARDLDASRANTLVQDVLQTVGPLPRSLYLMLQGPFERIYEVGGQGGYRGLASPEVAQRLNVVDFDEPFTLDANRTQIVPLSGDWANPESITFAEPSKPGDSRTAWYRQFCADLATRPVLVVTGESYPELLHYLRARPTKEFSSLTGPGYWVSDVSDAYVELELDHLGMSHVDTSLTCDGFLARALLPGRQDVQDGHRALARSRRIQQQHVGGLEVAALVRVEGNPPDTEPWRFLRGYDPRWSDIVDGRPVRFDKLTELKRLLCLDEEERNRIVIRGRAGSGKTALLMRLAFELTLKDFDALWIDRSVSLSATEVLEEISVRAPDVVLIDDVDLFGERIDEVLRKSNRNGKTLVVATIRSTMSRMITNPSLLKFANADEALKRTDLEKLTALLERAGLLGSLKRVQPRASRVDKLQQMCQNDLLAALIEVVTGVPFDQRIRSEFEQLDPPERLAYSIVCFNSAKVYESPWLPQEHLLQIMGGKPPFADHLAAVSTLLEKGLLNLSSEGLRPRHRAIADAVIRGINTDKEALATLIEAMLRFYAQQRSNLLARNDANRRRLITLLSHTLMRDLSLPEARVRQIYEAVQPDLQDDKHFWLQRGAYEVEVGDLDLADSYLESARACPGGDADYKIVTEWGFMRLAKAKRQLNDATAQDRAFRAIQELETVAKVEGRNSPHTFTVIVREGTAWLALKPELGAPRRQRVMSIIDWASEHGINVCNDNREVVQVITRLRSRIAALHETSFDDGKSNANDGVAFPM